MRFSKQEFEMMQAKAALHTEFMEGPANQLHPKIFVFLRDNPRDFILDEEFGGQPVGRGRGFMLADMAVSQYLQGLHTNKELELLLDEALGVEIGTKLAQMVLVD